MLFHIRFIQSLFYALFALDNSTDATHVRLLEDSPALIASSVSSSVRGGSVRELVASSGSRWPNFDLAVLRFVLATERKLVPGDRLWVRLMADLPRVPVLLFQVRNIIDG